MNTEALRRILFKAGLFFYRRMLKGTRLGNWIRNELFARGILPPAANDEDAVEAVGLTTEWQEYIEDIFISNDPSVPGFQWSQPLNLTVSGALAARPSINVLLPSLRLEHMSGGPNTALILAGLLADSGESVRLISTGVAVPEAEREIYPHLDRLLQRPVARDRITLADASERSKALDIGVNDIFVATAWWTARMAQYALSKTNYRKFIYLIQDFEPILHDGSTFQALALETYGLPHVPVINTELVLEHLSREGCGRYSNPAFVADALILRPAIDRDHFYPVPHQQQHSTAGGRRVLLFYARPTVAHRNLFGLGVAALRRAVAEGVLDQQSWEVRGMGEDFEAVPLGNDLFLEPLPWMDFETYAGRIRTADLMLSLMLSPHPSYPPLEMAASGNAVVTNSFSVKTADRLKALSPNILAADPTLDGIASVLKRAIGRVNAGLAAPDPFGTIDLPSDWNQSFRTILPRLREQIDLLRRSPSAPAQPAHRGYPAQPGSAYERYRRRRLAQRRRDGTYSQEPGLLSFVTCVYDTRPQFLEELSGSVFMQDGGTRFEWLILDNGSTSPETRKVIDTLSRHPCVHLVRVEENLGIVGGMRYCLELATGRYVLPLDSDDLIEPDCVHVITRFLRDAEYPALVYTDEDKVARGTFGYPYFKPDWDPVLLVHSCYVAHLCVIDREKALGLGVYTDPATEGSHDWDTFIRFMNAGYRPRHVPEVLYSWRLHSESTSANIAAKSYISDSHKRTLQRFLDHTSASHIQLVSSPLFAHDVDWWFRRIRRSPSSSVSVQFGGGARGPATRTSGDQQVISLGVDEGLAGLAQVLEQTPVELVHLCWDGVTPDSDEWLWEAMAMTELFPDAVMVGGTLHDGKAVLDGPRVFGFGTGLDCPDRGRSLTDPGYGANMWKHHTVGMLSSGHCVVRHRFLLDVLPELLAEGVQAEMLGPWLGGLAREGGRRVIFSPFISARASSIPEEAASSEARAHFLSRFWHLMPETQLMSPRLGLSKEAAYSPVTDAARTQHLHRLQPGTMRYAMWLDKQLRRRARRYPLPVAPATLTVVTAVYEGSDFSLLDRLAQSLGDQSLRPNEWIIVANGPFAEDHLQHLRESAAPHWNATLVVVSESLGIVGALRRGLDLAHSEYVVPVDADDELTPDALQVLANQIAQFDHPDLIYSDEDALVNGVPAAPYLRAPFDPILNLESSYIWHLFAISRETALGLGAYTDPGMDFCQDWDTVTRVANAGGRIEHVPEVLYHWRHHALSSTNKPSGDPRSLDSVRHLLEGQIGLRVAHPHHFSVAPWPIDRGAPELYIARSDSDLPKFAWLGEATPAWLSDDKNKDAVLVLTVGATTLTGDGAFIEAARLFDLHPRLGALGGRVLDPNGMVLDACFVKNEAGKLESPWVGHHIDDMGPYAMAGKPQSVATTGRFMAFLRVRALQEAGISVPEDSSLWSLWILDACAKLAVANWTVAYSPLLLSRTGTPAAGAASQESVAAARSVPMHAIARYGSLCPHDFHWRTHGPMSYPKRRTEPVVGKPQRIAVIYLNRHAEGERPVRRFIESYKANPGGIDHEFITIYKGFPERRLAHARKAFTEIETRQIAVDDDMTDIDAYLIAAKAFPDVDAFCFLNTFSEITCKDWLLHLHNAASRSDVGIAGASGSYESLLHSLKLTGKVIWLCAKGYLKYDRALFSQYRTYIGRRWAVVGSVKAIIPVGRRRGEDYRILGKYDDEFEQYWALLTAPQGVFAFLDSYPPFPNPNIRTNAFMIRRQLLLPFVRSSQRMKKHESYLFESGANSLTRYILDQGLRAMVVNCDGEMYDVDAWPRSRTFRLGDQAGLLVRDNQTRRYDRLTPAQKGLIAYMTWGTAAGYSPADVYTFGIHFDGTPLRYQARVNE